MNSKNVLMILRVCVRLCNQHEIHLTDDFKPRQTRAYRVPELLKSKIEKQISKLIELDFIEETDSPMTSGVVCVTKPDKSVRLCCDYRRRISYGIFIP